MTRSGALTSKTTSCPACGQGFIASRKGHLYCSDTCRKKAHKARKQAVSSAKRRRRIDGKLKKLSSNPFGQYLVRELRRAGSVEVLRGHTKASLDKLVELRVDCNRYSGYLDGRSTGSYELSHIYPVNGAQGLGRLHPDNLVIALRDFNRARALEEPLEVDHLCCDYALLDKKWHIQDGMTASQILKLARKFLKADFDSWLSGFPLPASRRVVLERALTALGHKKTDLKRLKLDEIRGLAEEAGCSEFKPYGATVDSYRVVSQQLVNRYPDNVLTIVGSLLDDFHLSMSPTALEGVAEESDHPAIRDFIAEQGNRLLHSMPYAVNFNGQHLCCWVSGVSSTRKADAGAPCSMPDDMDDDSL